MKRKVGIIKRIFALLLIFLLSINSFAAVVSDNDGSAFITKAEFDSLKNNFQAQIDQYNQSIDSKIDGAIASYLAGIKLDDTLKFICYGAQVDNEYNGCCGMALYHANNDNYNGNSGSKWGCALTDGFTSERDIGYGGSGYYVTTFQISYPSNASLGGSSTFGTNHDFPNGSFGPLSNKPNTSGNPYLSSKGSDYTQGLAPRDIALNTTNKIDMVYCYDLSHAFKKNISVWAGMAEFPIIKFLSDGTINLPVYTIGKGGKYDKNKFGSSWGHALADDDLAVSRFDVGIRHAGVYTKKATVTIGSTDTVSLSYEFVLDVSVGDELILTNFVLAAASTRYSWVLWKYDIPGWERQVS